MRRPFANSPEFRSLIEGNRRVSLATIALEIARDADPSVDIDDCLRRIRALSERVKERCPIDAGPKTKLGQINWVLYVEEDFQGDEEDYYDPRNSYLNEVLDRKRGIPISLATLYAEVAAPLGLELVGVNLPAHYMLRLIGAGPPLFIDAFHSGTLLDRAGCLRQISEAIGRPISLSDEQMEPCDPSTTVTRMLRNLKAIHVRSGDYATALPTARRLAAIEPTNLEEVRDWGLIAYHSGHVGESVEPLSRYVDAVGDASDREAIANLLSAARREMAQNN